MIDLRFQPMQERVKDPLQRKRYLPVPFSRTVGAGYDDLERELQYLAATDIVIESGHDRGDIRNDGWPRSTATASHPDIRLFFKCTHGALRYECNAFGNWQANLRAIGLWMQRQRLAIQKWGIGSGGEVYRGFAQLPPGQNGTIAAADWATVEQAAEWLYRQVFPDNMAGLVGGSKNLIRERECLREIWRKAAQESHPDLGGSTELMAKVNRAKDFIEKHAGVTA